jgi:hypothetical protein
MSATASVVCLLVLGVICLFYQQHRRALRFAQKWPPISDDKFLARCSPGVDRARALKVRRLVSEQLGIPYENIYPEQHFVNDLDCC